MRQTAEARVPGGAQRLQPGQVAVREQLEGCAAAGRDVVHGAVGRELGERGGGVASAGHGEPWGIGERLGHGAGPGLEPGIFEHPHRPVPEHRAGLGDAGREVGGRGGADVDAAPACWDARAELADLAARSGGHRLAPGTEGDDVGWQHEPVAVARQQPPAGVHHVRLAQADADRVALGGQEGEAHAATDQQHIGRAQQRFDDGELAAQLRAAQDGHEGTPRVVP